MREVREAREHAAARREVQPAAEVHRALLPLRAQRRPARQRHARHADAGEVQLPATYTIEGANTYVHSFTDTKYSQVG